MKLTKFEKTVLIACPWFFGMVLIIAGISSALTSAEKFIVLLLTASGLICMSLFCACVLLLKLVEK
jgi:hypothetical protein